VAEARGQLENAEEGKVLLLEAGTGALTRFREYYREL
jgi:hypothetical protein